MYKSSSLTFVYKCSPLLLLVCFFVGRHAIPESDLKLLYAMAPLLVFALVWSVVMLKRIRSVEANDAHLVIKTMRGPKVVQYQDIEWVYQMALINPPFISLQYRDVDSGMSQKILIVPPFRSRVSLSAILAEMEMTAYIREKALAANPGYARENEPSRYLAFIMMILSVLPVIFLMRFFMKR